MMDFSLRKVAVAFALMAGPVLSIQAASVSTETIADAFLVAGPGNYAPGTDLSANNYGGAGTLAVAPASSIKGEFQSVLKFNLASSISAFNAEYGMGN